MKVPHYRRFQCYFFLNHHQTFRELSVGKFNPESPLRIKMRRSHVWQDTLFELRRCSECDVIKLIKVQFIGEPAVNESGPRNEFFLYYTEKWRCLLTSVFGEPDSKCINHNILLKQKEYLLWSVMFIGYSSTFSITMLFLVIVSVVDYIVYRKL